VTFVLFHVAEFGGGDAPAEMVRGGLVANVTEICKLAVFPAISVACTEIALLPETNVRLQVKFDPLMEALTPLQVT